MSRGRGAVERALLAAVKRHRLVSVPAVIMWEVQHGNPQWDPYEESSLRSFRRAACRLEDQGLLRVWYFDLPSMYTVWGGGRNPW